MVQTYYDETSVKGKEYFLNHHRMKRIRNRYLLTTDSGGWVALSKEEYGDVLRCNISDVLFKILEEKGIIITRNNIDLIVNNTKERLGFLFDGPSLHIIIPTLRCDNKCSYCHSAARKIDQKEYDIDEETAKQTLNFIFQTPSKGVHVEFQGGDALLNLDMVKYIVRESKEMNKVFNKILKHTMVTNLNQMDHSTIEWCAKEDVSICTSLDGPESIHNKHRKKETGEGTYETVTSWIKKAKKEYDINISALMVTTKESLPYHREIIDEYVAAGANAIQIKHMSKLGCAFSSWDDQGYTAEDFLEFWKKSMKYIIELNKKGVDIKERFATILLRKLLNKRDAGFLDLRSPCGAVIGQITYDYNGDIYSCDEGRNYDIFKLGNVKEDKYAEIFNKNKTKSIISSTINENFLCENCVYKPYCGVCPVLNYAEEGNILPKLAINNNCKIFKAQFDYIFDKMLFDEEARKVLFGWV
jgi:His-Xaa-Ser system radical SAM maturase HxsB